MNLYPHQPAAVEFLKSRRTACLADDQGLGKTISAAVAARELGARSIAVIAPSVALWNWQRELKEWAGVDAFVIDSARAVDRLGDHNEAVITSHSLLLNDDVAVSMCTHDVLIVDESHAFMRKSSEQESQRARRLYRAVVPRVDRVWCLTGTPAPNGYACELWSMLHHLMPTVFTEGYSEFRSRYCVLRQTIYGDGWKPVKNQNTRELKQRMDGFIMRRLKKDVLKDLPPRRVETITVRPTKMPPGLDALSAKLMARVKRAKHDPEKQAEAVAAHAEVASADTPEEAFRAMMDHEHLSRFRRLSGEAKVEPAIELVLAEFAAGLDCIVLFAYHTETIDRLASALEAHHPVVVDGRVSPRARDEAVQAFQAGRAHVFIGQIGAAGTAITLTRAAEMLFVELDYTPGNNAQCADRIHRIGQRRSVRVRFLSLAHSVDEIIVEVVRNKIAMTQELLA